MYVVDAGCRTVVSGGGPEDIDTSHVRTYQIYRGMSPTTSNRLEVGLGLPRPINYLHGSIRAAQCRNWLSDITFSFQSIISPPWDRPKV